MAKYWLWVEKRGYVREDISPGKPLNWEGCNYETEKYDLAFIYRPKPYQHIRYLVKITSDSKLEPNPNDVFNCDFEVLYDFKDRSLSFKSMWENPELADWYPLKIMFSKSNFSIEKKYWDKLLNIVKEENPEINIVKKS